MPPGLLEVLPRRNNPAAARMLHRAEVDVVADVMLVQTHGAMAREPDVLAVQQVDGALMRRAVLEPHLPAPGGLVLGEHEAQRDAHPLPLATALEAAAAIPRRARPQRGLRPEQRHCLHAV